MINKSSKQPIRGVITNVRRNRSNRIYAGQRAGKILRFHTLHELDRLIGVHQFVRSADPFLQWVGVIDGVVSEFAHFLIGEGLFRSQQLGHIEDGWMLEVSTQISMFES